MRNQQIFEEAGEWFVRMRDGEESAMGVRAEFMEWLRRSPEHVGAYLDIAAVWMEAKRSNVEAQVELSHRIAAARADRSVAELAPRTGGARARFSRWHGLLAIAASVVLSAGLMTAWWLFENPSYATAVGEQRSIALRDGSTIELNSDSRVRVQFDKERRSIRLLRGQALFRVAKDATRPFIVHTDDTTVRAVGTVFDVYRKRGNAVVTVLEGAVVVEQLKHDAGATERIVDASASRPSSGAPRAQNGPGALHLTAGRQVVVGHAVAETPRSVNVAAVTAWTRRELVFEFTPLAQIAEEFNRYNRRQLVVEGERLRAHKISAIFRSTDSASLIRYMQSMPGVRIVEGDDAIILRPAER